MREDWTSQGHLEQAERHLPVRPCRHVTEATQDAPITPTDGSLVTLGNKTDAQSSATGTISTGTMSAMKLVSQAGQDRVPQETAINTLLGFKGRKIDRDGRRQLLSTRGSVHEQPSLAFQTERDRARTIRTVQQSSLHVRNVEIDHDGLIPVNVGEPNPAATGETQSEPGK